MVRLRLLAIVVGMAAFGVACSGDEGDGATLPTSATTTPPSDTGTALTTTTVLTTTTATDRTTPAESTSTPTPSSTVPPPTSVGVLHPVPDGTPPPQPIDEQPSATELRSTAFCDPDSPSNPAVALTWVPAGSGGQLLAISTLPDGFESGRYSVTDELAADITGHRISPIEPGGIYYWRVLTRSGDRWLSSVQESFTGPVCVLDSP